MGPYKVAALLAVLVILLVSTPSTQAQDGSLTANSYYTLISDLNAVELTGTFGITTINATGSSNSSLSNQTSNTVAYFFSTGQTTVWSVDISKAVASTSGSSTDGDISLVSTVTITDPSPTVTPILTAGTVDAKTKELYMASTDRLYHVLSNGTIVAIAAPPGDSSQTTCVDCFAPYTSATDQSRGLAWFPSYTYNFIYTLNFTIGNFSIKAPINTSEVISSAYDPDTGILYMGGIFGDMERFNTYTMKTEAYVDSATYLAQRDNPSSLERVNIVHSAQQKLLYVCTELGLGSVVIDVLDDATLELVNNFTIIYISSITSCGSLLLDDTEGELLVSLSDVSGVVFSYNLATNTQVDYTVLSGDQSTATIVGSYGMLSDGVTAGQLAYLITTTQIVAMSYASTCSEDCSGNGYCYFGNCSCIDGWTGDACDSHKCDEDCNSNGDCANGECVCFSDWVGFNCSVRQCSNNCSGHGICSDAPSYTCACTDSWSGDVCSVAPPAPPPPACDTITSLSQCVDYKACGWCANNKKCMDGSIRGPYSGSCANWTWDAKPENAVTVLVSIFLAILGLMFIFNAYSAITADKQRAEDFRDQFSKGVKRKPDHGESVRLWWRDQRSAKTWLWVEQLQFLVLVSHISLDFPTSYINFSRFFDWTNFGLPLPFHKDHDTYHADRVIYVQETSTSTRNLLGFEAYSNSLTIDSIYVFGGNMFWFAIALLGILSIYSFLIGVTWKSLHWRTTFIARMIYLLVRLMNMAYVGIVMTSAFAMAQTGHNYQQITPGFFVFLVIGIGYPALVWFILRGNPRKLVDDEFKYRFGCLYTNYHPANRYFALVLLGRKFFQAAVVGFLNYSLVESPKYLSIIQVVIMGVAQIAYTAMVFLIKPYYDYYHEYLEYFLCLVNLATLGLSMWQYHSPSQAGMLITGLVQVLGMVGCVGVYIVSWIYMNKESGFFARLFSSRTMTKGASMSSSDMGSIPLEHSDSTI